MIRNMDDPESFTRKRMHARPNAGKNPYKARKIERAGKARSGYILHKLNKVILPRVKVDWDHIPIRFHSHFEGLQP